LVLDASAALRALGSSAARATLTRFRLIGPPLLRSEVTSALHEALWRRQIDEAAAAAHRAAFARLDVTTDAPDELHAVAWAIADELGIAKTYDAEYLALARIRGTRVLTTDARLRRGAARTGLVIDPSELEGL
jgi:predicted nucleic acid-binding protein